MVLNDVFVENVKGFFGAERYERFAAALDDAPIVSVRANAAKGYVLPEGDAVPWCAEGRYLSSRPVFTADPLFHAGSYYVQEASSMFVEQAVKQYITGPVRMLDLCAAPGGKSTHLLSLLPKGSLLVANEPMPLRAQVLAENIVKWGNPSAVVTRNMPADFAKLRNFFDAMLVDAPCSGEGMFRKDAYAVEQWSAANVQQCAQRQREILTDVWDALRPGGLLIYSTCTFNKEEDEECVQWIASELGAEVLSIATDSTWNITPALCGDKPVYRFIPGYTRGEGFFLALLCKDGDADAAKVKPQKMLPAPAKIKSELAEWINSPDDFDLLLDGDVVNAFPKQHSSAIAMLQSKLKVIHAALPVASVKNNKMVPLHSLAMSTSLNSSAFEKVEIDRSTALAYLHREALVLPSAPLGTLLLTYQGTPIGFARNIGNRVNNLYPAEWRIRKNPIDL